MPKGPGPDYQVPSFELFRPVTNIDIDQIHDFEGAVFDMADELHAGRMLQNVQFIFGHPAKLEVPLISAEEVTRFHEHYGLRPTPADIKKVKDFIDKDSPFDLKLPAEISSSPISVYWKFPEGNGAAVIALGAGRQLLRDRHELKRTFHRLYEKPETDEEIAQAWPEVEPYPDGALLTIRGEEQRIDVAVGLVNLALARTNILPPVLDCKRVHQRSIGVYRRRPGT